MISGETPSPLMPKEKSTQSGQPHSSSAWLLWPQSLSGPSNYESPATPTPKRTPSRNCRRSPSLRTSTAKSQPMRKRPSRRRSNQENTGNAFSTWINPEWCTTKSCAPKSPPPKRSKIPKKCGCRPLMWVPHPRGFSLRVGSATLMSPPRNPGIFDHVARNGQRRWQS
jgi:hypothetical protein